MNKLSVIVYREDALYVAKGVEVELASQGKTAKEAIANLKEAFSLWLKHAESAEIRQLQKSDEPKLTQIAA